MPSGRIPDWKQTQAVMTVLGPMDKMELCEMLYDYEVIPTLVAAMWARRDKNGVQEALYEIESDQKDPWEGRKKRGFIFNTGEKAEIGEDEGKVPALKENPEPEKVEKKEPGISKIKVFEIEGKFSPGGAKAVVKSLK